LPICVDSPYAFGFDGAHTYTELFHVIKYEKGPRDDEELDEREEEKLNLLQK
jgi:hypothetical protein